MERVLDADVGRGQRVAGRSSTSDDISAREIQAHLDADPLGPPGDPLIPKNPDVPWSRMLRFLPSGERNRNHIVRLLLRIRSQ
jgi:hypothetical protein